MTGYGITTREAADILNVSCIQVRRLAARGVIRFCGRVRGQRCRGGSAWLVDRRDVWELRRKLQPTGEGSRCGSCGS